MRIDTKLVERVAQILEPYRDDEQCFLDTLDMETDAVWWIDKQLAGMQDDNDLTDALSRRIEELSARKKRLDDRAAARKATVLTVMQAMGMQKLERPLATLSVRKGSVRVNITDEASVPSQLCTVKTVRNPDKAAIKKQIDAGETVPGAELVTGDETLTVRVK